MKVYHHISEFVEVKNPVVTIGTFDGVHIGHRKILNRVKQLAKKAKGESVLLTLWPHPRIVLYPDDNDLKLLNTIDEKVELLRNSGLDHLIIHPFTKDFSRLTSDKYIRNILVNGIGAHSVVIGYNHHFGRNREGSFDNLQELGDLYGFAVEEIPAQEIKTINVSSTKIRNAITDGKVEMASSYLGYKYFFHGKVVEGNKNGREMGFPTANIRIKDKLKLIPGNGVYAVRVTVKENEYNGMMNIGYRPTINGKSNEQHIEINIFDFEKEIYNQTLKVEVWKRIRGEKKFDSLDDLSKQLIIDKNKCQNILK